LRADLDGGGYAFLVLLEDEDDARALAQLLDRVRDADSTPAVFLIPPARGLAFFADADRQAELDSWWSEALPRSAHPVYLMMDAAGLEEWLGGVDGTFYIGVRRADRIAAFPDSDRVRAFLCTGPLDIATVAMHDFCKAHCEGAGVFEQADALRMAVLSGHPLLRAGRAWRGGLDAPRSTASKGVEAPAEGDATAPTAMADLPDASCSPSRPPAGLPAWLPWPGQPQPKVAPAPESSKPVRWRLPRTGAFGRGPHASGLLGIHRTRRTFRPQADADLARQLAGRGTTLVVTGSRKGGVGKTSFAAGIAIAAGTVLDQVGHMTCIVDANIANPDAWGQMSLPDGAATVRATVAALLSNREPPPPAHATTPALACYPEVREATEYSRTAIRRLAAHLRRRYTLIVVDMSNRLPDPTAGPEAAVAAYWLEVADALVLPTTSARADFNGALDYLEVGDLPPTVVAYIVPATRRLRENPATLEYLRAIRRRAVSLVEVPDEADAVRLAGMEGVPAEQLSSRLRLAYRELTEVIAAMPRRLQA